MNDCKLIWATPNAEKLIGYLARVSNVDAKPSDPASKLMRYLIKHQHWSPFEMADMCLEINTTRGIAAQILRHKSFSFQEFSQRYADVSKLVEYIPTPELRTQDKKNRQNSVDNLDPFLRQEFEIKAAKLFSDSQTLYDEMLHTGIAKECARFVLPIATPTRMYMHGTLRSWIHYLGLRSSNGTQKEHRDITVSARDIFTEEFPGIAEACWGEHEEVDPKDTQIIELKAEIATLKSTMKMNQEHGY